MSLTVQSLENGKTIKIVVPERFDFSVHREFREAYENKPQGTRYIVDFGKTNYLDSSALGMLLQLREAAGGQSEAINIVNSKNSVNEVLAIANFDKLMMIN